MSFPDRTNTAAVRARLNEYQRRLEALQPEPSPEPVARLVSVAGGDVAADGGGSYVISVDRIPQEFSGPLPRVELTYRWGSFDEHLQTTVETSPAVLYAVDGVWRPGSFAQEPTTTHSFYDHPVFGRETVLVFGVASDSLAIGRLSHEPVAPEPLRFSVPPAATAIAGQGELLYNTGHSVRTGQAPQPLSRPTASGLARRPGPVYAEFRGAQAARVLIGNAWVLTPAL